MYEREKGRVKEMDMVVIVEEVAERGEMKAAVVVA